MYPVDALRLACREAGERFLYLPEERGEELWQTPAGTEARGGGDCEDFALWAIARSVDLMRADGGAFADSCEWRLIVGDLPNGRHAWAELRLAGDVWWADPTPGYGAPVGHPRAFGRTPLYAYRWEDGFLGQRFAYGEARP